jgi:RNA polymerase sigma-70 factor (ECF subfamily)
MYRVALNTAITHVRKSNRTITQEPLYDAVGQIASDFDAPADDERTEMLYAAINTLSSVDKAIVLLYLEENTYEEIASVVGISLQNVSVRLVRIRRKLEEKLRNQIK